MKKQIMSIAAIAALFTTGAMAFDTNSVGDVLNSEGTKATFTSSAVNAGPVLRDSDFKGDTLIYPAMNQDGNWGTEITVRNNMPYAIVAKAVVYRAKDSKEVKDFNIYLSANDVCRFQIKDGYITSKDDSIVSAERYADDERIFADKREFKADLSTKAGYVVVYGLGEDTTNTVHGGNAKVSLFKSYRNDLRLMRKNWDAEGRNLKNGVYTGQPAVTVAPYVLDTNTTLKDVNDTALSGQVRIFNDTAGDERDLLLNATSVQNYTEPGKIMLWAPREYASMADRDMTAAAKYDPAKLDADAAVYKKTGAYYTYNNAGSTPNIENKLLITQMYKRTLTQLQTPSSSIYWSKLKCAEDETKTNYAFIATTNGNLWDESEHSLNPTPELPALDLFVSPATGTPEDPDIGYCNELAEISSPEKGQADYENKNGYVKYKFVLPAIVTQMSASNVGDTRRINWVNSVTNID